MKPPVPLSIILLFYFHPSFPFLLFSSLFYFFLSPSSPLLHFLLLNLFYSYSAVLKLRSPQNFSLLKLKLPVPLIRFTQALPCSTEFCRSQQSEADHSSHHCRITGESPASFLKPHRCFPRPAGVLPEHHPLQLVLRAAGNYRKSPIHLAPPSEKGKGGDWSTDISQPQISMDQHRQAKRKTQPTPVRKPQRRHRYDR